MIGIELFIAGAQKAGTTSLLRYLGEHPQVDTHYSDEFSYFAGKYYEPAQVRKAIRNEFSSKPDGTVRVAKHAHLYKE